MHKLTPPSIAVAAGQDLARGKPTLCLRSSGRNLGLPAR